MIILYILFCLYASLEGVIEAILYGRKGAETFKWNEHMLYVAGRAVVLVGMLYCASYVDFNLIGSAIGAIICILSFSFFHDGFYYETARRINRPDYRFSSNSKTSTARLEMPWFVRANMFIVSVIILLVYQYL